MSCQTKLSSIDVYTEQSNLPPTNILLGERPCLQAVEHIKLQKIHRLISYLNFHCVCVSDIFEDSEFSTVNQLFDDIVRGLLQLIESSETTTTVSSSVGCEHSLS